MIGGYVTFLIRFFSAIMANKYGVKRGVFEVVGMGWEEINGLVVRGT